MNKQEYSFTEDTLLQHSQLELDNYTVHYYHNGNLQDETIVFLHPAFANHYCFQEQVSYFANHYNVITIDLLGHGLSKPNSTRDKIDASILHIDTILQKFGIGHFHLVGVSMGSLLAQYFALQYPSKVSSLTVVGGYNINADNSMINKAQRSEQIKWIFKALFSMDSFRKYVAGITVSKAENQAKFYEMSKQFQRSSFRVMSGLGKVLQKRNIIQRSYPLMIVIGEHDLPLARNAAVEWHNADSGSYYKLIPNAGHCANMDQPAEFNAVLESFIKQPQKK